jgi:hypothetical protein
MAIGMFPFAIRLIKILVFWKECCDEDEHFRVGHGYSVRVGFFC